MDCGGPTCGPCADAPANQLCLADRDCSSGYCFRREGSSARCASFFNGRQDGDETCIDGGGAAGPLCSEGQGCFEGSRDCRTGICGDDSGLCRSMNAAERCSNGLMDGSETGIDCGGPLCSRFESGGAFSPGTQTQHTTLAVLHELV